MEFELTPEALVLIPIVAAILQVVKSIATIDKLKPWFPFIGVAVAYVLALLSGVGPYNDAVMPAIVIGLSAAGAYDAVKAPSKKIK